MRQEGLDFRQVVMAVVSKAKSWSKYMDRARNGPPSQRNCFSVQINGVRIKEKIGAGDTMADGNVMGANMFEEINAELRRTASDKLLVLQTSKLPFVVEVANGETMSLTRYVELDLTIYVDDTEDPECEYMLESDIKVVVWVADVDMREILLGAAWLDDQFGLNLEHFFQKHEKAKRIRRSTIVPRNPDPLRAYPTDRARLETTRNNVIRSLRHDTNTSVEEDTTINIPVLKSMRERMGNRVPQEPIASRLGRRHEEPQRRVSFVRDDYAGGGRSAVNFEYSHSEEEMFGDENREM